MVKRSGKGVYYILIGLFLFLAVIICSSSYQIWDINEHGHGEDGDGTGGWDFRGYEEYFMKVALVVFGIVIPILLSLLLLPVLIRSFKWTKDGFDKSSRRMMFYGILISFVYAGGMLLFGFGNLSDGLIVPGIAAIIGLVLNLTFIVSGIILIATSSQAS